jgi:hypothetical protein
MNTSLLNKLWRALRPSLGALAAWAAIPLGLNAAVLVDENFNDGTANGWNVEYGSFYGTGGQYLTYASAMSSVGNSAWDDYEVQADIQINHSSTHASIFGRFQNTNNFYNLEIHSGNNELALWKCDGGSWTKIGSSSQTINSNTWYEVKLVMDGTTLKGYLGGTELIAVTDSAHAAGKTGVRAGNDARWDDFLAQDVTSGSGGSLLFSDDFNDGNDDGWSASSSWTMDSGQYYNQWNGLTTAGSSSWDDYSVRAHVKLDTSTYGGIVGRYNSSNNYYMLEIHDSLNKFSLYKQVNGSWTEIAYTNTNIVSGTWYWLELEMDGSTLKGYLNDQQLISVTDSTFSAGKIGLRSGNDAHFDDVTVEGTSGGGSGGSGQGAPTEVSSFGPNGTHWPSSIETPFLYDTSVPHVIDVACTWTAIANAISSIDATEASQGVLIRVAPGTLYGNGAGSSSTPVLSNLGSSSWSKRITVAPRDGWGTIEISGGARIYQVKSVCFAGFDADEIAFHGNDHSALAWTRISEYLAVNGYSGAVLRDVEMVEIATPESFYQPGSPGDFWNCFSNGASEVSGFRWVGCYAAPRFREASSSHHTDCLQFEDTNGGVKYEDPVVKDCAFFASSNTALLVNGADGLVIENTYILAGSELFDVYPLPSGADSNAAFHAINGNNGINLQAIDSIIVGNITPQNYDFSYVNNTVTSDGNPPLATTGQFNVDASLDSSNPTPPTKPTQSYLESIWGL